MAATSTNTSFATKPTATGAGLTPIWIRLPRLDDADSPSERDADATARSLSHVDSYEDDGEIETSRVPGVRSPAISPRDEGLDDDAGLPEEAPAYLRRLAERQRAADDEDDIEDEVPRKRTDRRRTRSAAGEGGFSRLLKAPYNVLAGIVLVAVFVGLYACFRPPTSTDETLPEIEPGPSLSLDMGDPTTEPYVQRAEPVDPDSLSPETAPDALNGALPGGQISGIASANYGAGPETGFESAPGFEPVPAEMPSATYVGPADSVPAMQASSAGVLPAHAGLDPALEGLPLETYPETDPATYRYPAEATFELSPAVERTAEGDSVAPRAASLGDSLEKTPVR